MDFEQARFNMVEQQIRPWEVLDQHVLDVILNTPREDFVPDTHRALAFADTNIPLKHDQVMMRPNVEGRMLQALAIQKSDVVLEIGTGSAYVCACLAQLAEHVYSIDIYPDFIEEAKEKLRRHQITNVTLSFGDAASKWDRLHKYDVIAITGSAATVPQWYKSALSINGRMFVITGKPDTPIMEAWLITRIAESQWTQESLFETSIPALINSDEPRPFIF